MDDEQALAGLRAQFAGLERPPGTRRERETRPLSYGDRRALAGRAREIKDQQMNFKTTRTFKSQFYATAAADGVTPTELFERVYRAYMLKRGGAAS